MESRQEIVSIVNNHQDLKTALTYSDDEVNKYLSEDPDWQLYGKVQAVECFGMIYVIQQLVRGYA